MKITQQQLETCDITHRHGGNGWVMVQDIDATHCRLAYYGKDLGSQAFLAHKDMLTVTSGSGGVDVKIGPDTMAAVEKLREEIKAGRLIIKSSHIVKA